MRRRRAIGRSSRNTVSAGAVALVLVASSVVALAAGAAGAGAAGSQTQGVAPPGITTAQVSTDGGVIVFTTYPDMATCAALYLTYCFEFTDGTVQGAANPLTLANEVVGLLPGPLSDLLMESDLVNPCFNIPQMGSSNMVRAVVNDTSRPLLIGEGSCANFKAGDGRIEIIPPKTVDKITPLDPYAIIPDRKLPLYYQCMKALGFETEFRRDGDKVIVGGVAGEGADLSRLVEAEQAVQICGLETDAAFSP